MREHQTAAEQLKNNDGKQEKGAIDSHIVQEEPTVAPGRAAGFKEALAKSLEQYDSALQRPAK